MNQPETRAKVFQGPFLFFFSFSYSDAFWDSVTALYASSALSGLLSIKSLVFRRLIKALVPFQPTHEVNISELVQTTSVPVTGASCAHHLRAYSCSGDSQWGQFMNPVEALPPVQGNFA